MPRHAKKRPARAKKPQESQKATDTPFYCVDGSTIKSISELADALDKMSDDVFYYHVSQFKNDFATWVNDVFSKSELSKEMGVKGTREHNLIVVLKFLLRE